MAKKEFEHCDKIGRPITVGDPVAYPHHNGLKIGTITTVNEKMCRVKPFGANATDWRGRPEKGQLKYPKDMVLIDGQDITMYLLKFGKET